MFLPAIGIVGHVILGTVYAIINLMSLGAITGEDYSFYYLSKMVVNIGILLYSYVLAWRFFRKYWNAPQTLIRYLFFNLLAPIIFFAIGLIVFGRSHVVLTALAEENPILQNFIAAVIWIPYFKVSKRVKATFTNQGDTLPYKIALPIRYLISKRISWLALSAVALCVFIVVIVMTVMAGLVNDFKEKNHLFAGDCVVGTESLVGFAYYEDFMKRLDDTDFVEAVSPTVKSYALIGRKGSDSRVGVEIMGVDPAMHSKATGFGQTLMDHERDPSGAFEPAHDPNLPGIVFGIDLLDERDIHGQYTHDAGPNGTSYSVSCFPLTPRGAAPGSGTEMVNTKTFHYSDKSQSGLARVDGALAYLPLEWTQILCGMTDPSRVNAIHIKFKQGVGLKEGSEKVASLWEGFERDKADEDMAYLLNTVTVRNWKDYRRDSIAPMEKEQTLMSVMFGFVGITTVFIVFVVSYMIISHKTKDIGILKSVGASNCDIIQLFSGFGFLVGLLGSGIGLLAGWLFLAKINEIEGWLFDHFMWQLWDRTIYAIGDIPSRIEPKVVITIFVSAILACLAGVLVPSWQAARQKPIETLQVNQL